MTETDSEKVTHIPDGIELTPFSEPYYEDPYPVLAQLRKLDPIHKDEQSFYENSWTISDHATVKALLTDPRLSVDPRSIGLRRDPRADNAVTLRDPNMMNLDEPEHSRLRSLIHKAFTPSSIDAFRSQIESTIDLCLDAIDGDQFDLVSHISKPVPTITIAEYIGISSDRHLDFKRWTDSLTKQGFPVPSEAQWQEIVTADADMREFMSEVVAARTREPQDDLVTRLVKASDEELKLTTDEVIEMCFLLVGAGNFTTTDLISNCVFARLSKQTDNQASDVEIVKETLRFDPPVMAIRRYVKKDIELHGNQIRTGSVVNLLIGSANHDPEVFPQPDQFSTENFAHNPAANLAFGRGIHHCLGAPLAKLEAEIVLDKLFTRYPEAKLVSAKRSRRMDFRGFSSLVLRV